MYSDGNYPLDILKTKKKKLFKKTFNTDCLDTEEVQNLM